MSLIPIYVFKSVSVWFYFGYRECEYWRITGKISLVGHISEHQRQILKGNLLRVLP